MAKKYTCGECGETLRADRKAQLVEMVQEHAHDEHDMELEPEAIRPDIEDS